MDLITLAKVIGGGLLGWTLLSVAIFFIPWRRCFACEKWGMREVVSYTVDGMKAECFKCTRCEARFLKDEEGVEQVKGDVLEKVWKKLVEPEDAS